jgi:hypothetical protein
MKKIILVLTLVLVTFSFLGADVYIKQKTNVEAFMGQPAKEMFSEQWLGDNKMATISTEQTQIVDLKAQKMILIQHGPKTYIEANLPFDMSKFVPDNMAPMMKQMMENVQISCSPTGQTKKILDYEANGFEMKMKMMGMDGKIIFWVSDKVPFEWKKYSKIASEMFKAQFRMGEKFVKEYEKMNGYIIGMDFDMMGMKMSSKTVQINPDHNPAPNVYAIPTGYKKTDKLAMQGR